MSMIQFYSEEDYEHASRVVADVLEAKMNSGILNVPYDFLSGSRRTALNRLALDVVSALARSDIAMEVPVTGDISEVPGINVERV